MLSNRDMETLSDFLDDDVVWTISGPVDIPPFRGRRGGRKRGDVMMGNGMKMNVLELQKAGGPPGRP